MGMVLMPRSEVMFEPWKDQEIARGWSPFVTMQETWAKPPSSMMSLPKVSGSRSGGSKEFFFILGICLSLHGNSKYVPSAFQV